MLGVSFLTGAKMGHGRTAKVTSDGRGSELMTHVMVVEAYPRAKVGEQ